MQIIKANLRYMIKATDPVIAEDQPYEDQERALFHLSGYYRMLAIACLLGDADMDSFFQNLTLSAQMRKRLLLLHQKTKQKPGRFLCTSHIAPLLDAVVAGNEILAAEIVSLSVEHWIEDEEYEEDFCYARFLHSIIQHPGQTLLEQKKRLTEYSDSLQGNESTRFSICQAILAKDQACFESEIAELLEEWEEQYREEEKRLIIKSERHRTEKYIFIEGLALLRIAEKIGLKTQEEYKYCPSLARLPMKKPFPSDGYPKSNK